MYKNQYCTKIVCLMMMMAALFILQSTKSMASADFDIDARGYVTYKGDATNVTVPSTVDGKQVKGINTDGFNGKTNLQSVALPNTVVEIGNNAFVNCTNLTTINLPEGLTIIGERAFMATALTSITLPNSITTIKTRAFERVKSITAIAIPGTVEEIGNQAFYECTNLQTITLNDGLKRIKDNAFSKTKVNNVVLPNSVIELESNVFFGCTELTTITLSNSLQVLGSQTFMNTGLTSITIPGTVTEIGPKAFYEAKSLEEVTINSGVTRILNEAFKHCTSLRTLVFPDTLEYIGEDAFWKCALTQVNFPDTLTFIGPNAFALNTGLTRAEFPTVDSYEPYAFSDCNITELVIPYTDKELNVLSPNMLNLNKVSIDYGTRPIDTVLQDDWIAVLARYKIRALAGITQGFVFNSTESKQVKPGVTRTPGVLASFNLTAVGQAGEVTMDPVFQSTVKEYNITVPPGTTKVQYKFAFEKLAKYSFIYHGVDNTYDPMTTLPDPVFGIYTVDRNLVGGKSDFKIKSFETGFTTYLFHIQAQAPEKGGEIVSIYAAPGEIKPSFKKEITNYSVSIPSFYDEFELGYVNTKNTTVTTRIPARNEDIAKGDKISFNGDNEVVVEIKNTPVTGDPTTYTFRVVKNSGGASTNTRLSSVNLDPNVTLTPTFTPDVKTYTATVGAENDFITIIGVPEDPTSTVIPVNNRRLAAGTNTYQLRVYSESGTDDVYTFNITRTASSNLEIESVKVDNRLAAEEGDTDVYKIEVDKASVDIVVEPARPGTTFDKTFPYNVNLVDGNNTVNIVATAENGATNTYQIIIKKVDRIVLSSNANLSDLQLSRGAIVFNKYTKEYSLTVDDNVENLGVTPVLEDPKASFVVSSTTLNYGSNVINVTVTAQDGSKKIYVLNVKRKTPINNTDLKSLLTNTGNLDRPFTPNVTEYRIQVDYSISDITIYAEPLDDDANVVRTTTRTLSTGNNVIPITVTARNGTSKKTYNVTVVRLAKNDAVKSMNARLSLLQPSSGSLEPAFQPGLYNYSMTVASDVNTVSFTGFKQHPRATVVFPPAKTIVRGAENIVEVAVTAEDGVTTSTYRINITKRDANDRPYMSIAGPSKDITMNEGNFTIQGGLKCRVGKEVTVSATIGGVTKNQRITVAALTSEQMNSATEKGTAWTLVFPYSELTKASYTGVTVTYTDGTTGTFTENWNYILNVKNRSNTAPTITITEPSANMTLSTGTFTMRGSYSDLEGDSGKVYATINGVKKEVAVTGGNWELSWYKRDLAVKAYTGIQVTAEDSRGGTKTATLPYTLTVEASMTPNRDPRITVETPSKDVGLRSGSFILSGKVSDEDNQTLTISATLGRVTKTVDITNTGTEKTWSLEWTKDELAPDSYFNIPIEVIDTDGGRATTTWAYTLTVEMGSVQYDVIVDGSKPTETDLYIDVYNEGADITAANKIGRFNVVNGKVDFGSTLSTTSRYCFIIDRSTLPARGTILNGKISKISSDGFGFIYMGDYNDDRNIDEADFASFQTYYIENDPTGDLNGDRITDEADFAIFAQSYIELQ